MSTSEQSVVRLVAIDDLGDSQVTVVEETPHGALAVGMSEGKPFAVSNRCRHLFASLGNGHVTDDGCLECPWHAALYDVGTGKMVRGPQGAFKPLAGAIKATAGAGPLKGPRSSSATAQSGWSERISAPWLGLVVLLALPGCIRGLGVWSTKSPQGGRAKRVGRDSVAQPRVTEAVYTGAWVVYALVRTLTSERAPGLCRVSG